MEGRMLLNKVIEIIESDGTSRVTWQNHCRNFATYFTYFLVIISANFSVIYIHVLCIKKQIVIFALYRSRLALNNIQNLTTYLG